MLNVVWNYRETHKLCVLNILQNKEKIKRGKVVEKYLERIKQKSNSSYQHNQNKTNFEGRTFSWPGKGEKEKNISLLDDGNKKAQI